MRGTRRSRADPYTQHTALAGYGTHISRIPPQRHTRRRRELRLLGESPSLGTRAHVSSAVAALRMPYTKLSHRRPVPRTSSDFASCTSVPSHLASPLLSSSASIRTSPRYNVPRDAARGALYCVRVRIPNYLLVVVDYSRPKSGAVLGVAAKLSCCDSRPRAPLVHRPASSAAVLQRPHRTV